MIICRILKIKNKSDFLDYVKSIPWIKFCRKLDADDLKDLKFCCAWICGYIMAIQEMGYNWKENSIEIKHVDEMNFSNCIYRVDKIKNLIK